MKNDLQQELDNVEVSSSVTDEIARLMRDYRNPKFSSKPPAKFVFDDTVPPMEQENQVIDYFFDNWVPKKKNIHKMVKRIYPQVPKFLQRSILDCILNFEVEPVGFMISLFDEKAKWAEIMPQMLAEGNHGVISDDFKVYGFEIKTVPRWLNDKQQPRWHPDDEYDIMQKAIEDFVKDHKLSYVDVRIMLFPEFGFSGMPRRVRRNFAKE